VPHLIPKSTNASALYDQDVTLLTNPDWKAVGWPGDPNYHVNLPGIIALYDADVPAAFVKAVDIGGGVFQAEEMTAGEKLTVILPDLRANKKAALSASLAAQTQADFTAAQQAILFAAVDAAANQAALDAITATYTPDALAGTGGAGFAPTTLGSASGRVLTLNGSLAPVWATPSGGGGSANVGYIPIDFGPAPGQPGPVVASVTGQSMIASTNVVFAAIRPQGWDSTSQEFDDQYFDDIAISVGQIIDGVGFDIYAVSRTGRAHGTYNVAWMWA
jgi:hypothetical protein